MTSKWLSRLDLIRQMVADDKTDAEIGKFWGVTGAAIYQVRAKYGITRLYVRRKPTPFEVPETTKPLIGEIYVDEAGLTVTRYPARYARGADVLNVTARRRGRSSAGQQ